MMIGSVVGSGVPVSLSFMSFIAMENSNLSIFPSRFKSARAHISANTEAVSPDLRKNFLACSPEMYPIDGERVSKFWSCFSLSSGEIAQTLGPPFIFARGGGGGGVTPSSVLSYGLQPSFLSHGQTRENSNFRAAEEMFPQHFGALSRTRSQLYCPKRGEAAGWGER